MQTAVIQIGNSDDKLTQKRWYQFCYEVESKLLKFSKAMHFNASSPGNCCWQNHCWVIEPKSDAALKLLVPYLEALKIEYGQDSIALTVGNTEFV